jgi:Flp pilus assembly protein TadG
MGLSRLGKQHGHSVVEVALMAPWLFFLFVGIFDFGFYAHALISTQNAARAAALAAGTDALSANQTMACLSALGELKTMPNSASLPATCNGPPLAVTVTQFVDLEGNNGVRVQVAYQPLPLIPIPGLLSGNLTITRTVNTPVLSD